MGRWPTTVAYHGGKTTFSGVARAGKALSDWAGDHRQLGSGGAGTPAQGCRLPRPARPSVPCPALESPPCTDCTRGPSQEGAPPDRKAKGPQKEMEGEEGKEKCDIPAREREREMERDRDCKSARAGVRQGGLQKEQRRVSTKERRQTGRLGLLPTTPVQENRSHFWTSPHYPISSLVRLLPRVCSPGGLRGVAGPSPVGGPGVGTAGPCSLPEMQGEASAPQPRSYCSPTPHSKSGSSSPFLPHPAFPSVPCPALESPPCTEPWTPRILEQAGWGAGLIG